MNAPNLPIAPRSARNATPELLAPAGDRECLRAAIENGADAVFFGLKGHNARARAVNFDTAELPEIMAELHRRGVRGYVTLNTLVFPSELDGLEQLVREVATAGVDAVIVQDVGLVRLIRAITPDLEIHASTQMSITSSAGVRMAQALGCTRVILARELSIKEIARIRSEVEFPLEIFVHGALCVSYSGQCLTSESLGGRSANRGECAQACRMPYQIVADGRTRDLGDIQYLLSPQDLAAYDLIPELTELGIASFKIEGRLKTPEYVANITRHYRAAIDNAVAGSPKRFTAEEVRTMQLSFSRGFSHGFLDGDNHKVLVRGEHAKKRGIFLGRVTAIQRGKVRVRLSAPIKRGDGVVFDGVDRENLPEQGGRVYDVLDARSRNPLEVSVSTDEAWLAFGHDDLDLRALRVGQRIWKTDDPELTRQLRRTYQGPPHRLVTLDFEVWAVAGEPLRVIASAANGTFASYRGDVPLPRAEKRTTTPGMVVEQMGRLGGTVYTLGDCKTHIESDTLVPLGWLNAARRRLVERIDESATTPPVRMIAHDPVLPVLRASLWPDPDSGPVAGQQSPFLAVLCSNVKQLEAAIAEGVACLYVDFHDIRLYRDAVRLARAASSQIYLATPRIEKPGESNLLRFLEKLGPDGLLVRHAGGLEFCVQRRLLFIADFSLNASNELTVEWLKARGASRVTASYDLSFGQLEELVAAVPPEALEIVIHQRVPMFHMQHCAFCAFLSQGTDRSNCGRPCDRHEVRLRDRVGVEHPLKADVGCRNTLYNAVPQSAAEYLPRLLECGVRAFRLEFLDDSPETVAETIRLYSEAMAGTCDARQLWKRLKGTNLYGVTRGQLAIHEPPPVLVELSPPTSRIAAGAIPNHG